MGCSFYNINVLNICNVTVIISGMTNKLAPYRNEAIMHSIRKWWVDTYPNNRAEAELPLHAIELYKSYSKWRGGLEPFMDDYMDVNQFAKCLVAAKIADIGGIWSMLHNWEPKEYEIRRAKVY
jgi:hypothetical protein